MSNDESPIGGYDPALVSLIREQVMAELESKDSRAQLKLEEARASEDAAHQEYIQKMSASSEPWVEWIGIVHDPEHGVKIQLEWNNAFVSHLQEQGIPGADEDQIIHHWLTLVLRDMTTDMESATPEESDFE